MEWLWAGWLLLNVLAASVIVREAWAVDDSFACLILPVWRMRLKARFGRWAQLLFVLAVIMFAPFLVMYYLWLGITLLIALIFCGK